MEWFIAVGAVVLVAVVLVGLFHGPSPEHRLRRPAPRPTAPGPAPLAPPPAPARPPVDPPVFELPPPPPRRRPLRRPDGRPGRRRR